MKKKKFRLRKGVIKVLRNTIILIILGIMLLVAYKNIEWYIENNKNEKQIINIHNTTTIAPIEEKEEIIVNEPEIKEPEKNPYWDFVKMDMFEVDFALLKEINNDVVGWIEVGGTNINYPFVQTDNNDYYLTHSFDKRKNSAGWVFMDYRNSKTTLNRNMILYAHARRNKTMFGDLRTLLTSDWLNHPENFYVKVATEKYSMVYQVFSIYNIDTTNDYLRTSFVTGQQYVDFLTMLKNRSSYDFRVDVGKDDYIITLSTCYNDTQKTALHAKLIKYQNLLT